MTLLWPKTILSKLPYVLYKRYAVGQFVYQVCFSIHFRQPEPIEYEIQSHSRFKSVGIYTAVHVTAVSLTPLCMSQRCQGYKFACHSDTAVACTVVSMIPLVCSQVIFPHKKHCFVSFAKIFEAMFGKALTRVSETQGKLFDEKKQRSKISCQEGPFNKCGFFRLDLLKNSIPSTERTFSFYVFKKFNL
jgi:hypothetical protein